jgi:hypothetical protein
VHEQKLSYWYSLNKDYNKNIKILRRDYEKHAKALNKHTFTNHLCSQHHFFNCSRTNNGYKEEW